MIIGLVDASTGKVLWTNMGSSSQDLYSSMLDNVRSHSTVEKERLKRLIDSVFNPFNASKIGLYEHQGVFSNWELGKDSYL